MSAAVNSEITTHREGKQQREVAGGNNTFGEGEREAKMWRRVEANGDTGE